MMHRSPNEIVTPYPVAPNFENLKRLMHNLPGGIFQYRFTSNDSYTIEFISNGAAKLLKRPLKELRHPHILHDYLHPEDVEFFMESIQAAYTDLSPWVREARVIIQKEIKWIRAIATSERMPDGSVLWNGILTDITPEKKTQLADAANERRQGLLNATINEMLNLCDLRSIYNHITDFLGKEYPECAISFSRVDETGIKSYPVSNKGFDLEKMKHLSKVFGFDFLESKYEISTQQYKKYCTGKLIKFDKGFEDFISPDISSAMAEKLNKSTPVSNIYGIGITKSKILFGIILFFAKDKGFVPDPLFIEAFAKQSGLIIERKLMEKALQKSEENFRTLVENQGEGLILTDLNQNITFANPASARIFGLEAEKLIKKNLSEFLDKDDFEAVRTETKTRVRGETSTYELTIMQPSGLKVPILATVTPQMDKDGTYIASFGVFRDISKLKDAEQKLKHSEEKYRTFINNATDGISLADENGRIIHVNKALEHITGFTDCDVLNMNLCDFNSLLAPKKKRAKKVNELTEKPGKTCNIDNEESVNKEIQFPIVTKDGTEKIIEAKYFSIKTQSGKRFGTIFRDITAQKKAALQLNEIDEAKNKLFSIMGHDLKNPMGNITNLSELLLQNIDLYPAEKVKRYLDLIHQTGESALQLLENLLLWSRTQKTTMAIEAKNENICRLAEKTITLLSPAAAQKHITITNYLPENCMAFADRNMISTVFRNLLSNAIKYTEKGGNIILKSKMKKDSVKVYVSDDGIGMDEATIATLFHPAGSPSREGTANEKGTGLGLIICHEYVKANKGKLTVKSHPGKGSTFVFSLPLSKD